MQTYHASETRCAPYLVLHLSAAIYEEAEINHPLWIQQNIIVDDWSWASTLFAFSLLLLFSLLLVVLTSLQQSWLLLHTMMCILLFMQSAISLGEDQVVKLLIINIPIFFLGENWKRFWRDLLEEAAKTTLTSFFKGLPMWRCCWFWLCIIPRRGTWDVPSDLAVFIHQGSVHNSVVRAPFFYCRVVVDD